MTKTAVGMMTMEKLIKLAKWCVIIQECENERMWFGNISSDDTNELFDNGLVDFDFQWCDDPYPNEFIVLTESGTLLANLAKE